MYTFFLITASLLAFLIISLVLMQHGKGADTGASFGGGASGTVFGARGHANFLSRCTSIASTLFFLNCLVLAWLVKAEPIDASLLNTIVEEVPEQEAPAAAAAPSSQEPQAEPESLESTIPE